MRYVFPDDRIKEKVRCNGINQRNMKFTNPIDVKESDELNYENFENLYIYACVNGCSFTMPDLLKKTNYKRNKNDKINKAQMFSIYSTTLVRQIFKKEWDGRTILQWPVTIPNSSIYDDRLIQTLTNE